MSPCAWPKRRIAALLAATLLAVGCIPDGPPPWEAWELPAPGPSPTPVPAVAGDYSGDTKLAWARFGFILLAVGGLAGVVALQSKLQREKSKDPDTKQEDVGWPIAIFGLGLGFPIYLYSVIVASSDQEEAEKQKLRK